MRTMKRKEEKVPSKSNLIPIYYMYSFSPYPFLCLHSLQLLKLRFQTETENANKGTGKGIKWQYQLHQWRIRRKGYNERIMILRTQYFWIILIPLVDSNSKDM